MLVKRFAFTTLLSCMVLTGCIPRGAQDHRIKSGPNAEESSSARVPQPVPEEKVIAVTPSWNPAVVDRNAQQVRAATWTVKKGDTLYAIGTQTGASTEAIARLNDLVPPYALRTGSVLQIPAGLYHRVSPGETGIAISRAYAVPWGEIVELNGLASPYTLRVGQNLLLPDRVSGTPAAGGPTPEQRADAFSLNIDDILTGGAVARPSGASLATSVSVPSGFAGAFGWPLQGALVSRFGSQGGGRVNDGINIGAAQGTAVTSAGAGTVVYAGNEIGVYGGLVLVDHGGGWVTAYGHLGSLNVGRGDSVTRGQALGGVGDTGYVDTPQLHFEIRKDRKPVDPMTKLPAR
jgi:murein DD-endopeptidase MepM/ murein hydrolase activator NlpD